MGKVIPTGHFIHMLKEGSLYAWYTPGPDIVKKREICWK